MSKFCIRNVSKPIQPVSARCGFPLGEATLLSLPALAKPSSEAARVPLPRWGEASRRAAPGGSRSRATAISPPAPLSPSAATNCGPPAWKAAILAALQPPAGHHRISQSPVVGSCVPRDRHLPVGRGVPPSRQVGSLVPRDRVSRRRITLTISA